MRVENSMLDNLKALKLSTPHWWWEVLNIKLSLTLLVYFIHQVLLFWYKPHTDIPLSFATEKKTYMWKKAFRSDLHCIHKTANQSVARVLPSRHWRPITAPQKQHLAGCAVSGPLIGSRQQWSWTAREWTTLPFKNPPCNSRGKGKLTHSDEARRESRNSLRLLFFRLKKC